MSSGWVMGLGAQESAEGLENELGSKSVLSTFHKRSHVTFVLWCLVSSTGHCFEVHLLQRVSVSHSFSQVGTIPAKMFHSLHVSIGYLSFLLLQLP